MSLKVMQQSQELEDEDMRIKEKLLMII